MPAAARHADDADAAPPPRLARSSVNFKLQILQFDPLPK
jgi:hypothetical protein